VKLLNQIRVEDLAKRGLGEFKEDPLNPEYSSIDPFGTGLDKKNREFEIIPEWRSPGREIPSIRETILEGKGAYTSSFRLGAVYRESWNFYRRNFRRLYLGGWLTLFVGFGVFAPFAPWLFQSFREGTLLTPTRILFLILFYPMTGLFSSYCFRFRRDPNLPLTQIVHFAGYYPCILFCLGWMLLILPLLLSLIYALAFLGQLFIDFPLAEWVYKHLAIIAGGVLFYLWWRCWFLHQAVYDNPDLHPLTILGRAYFATSGQLFRLLVFSVFQTGILVIGTLLFGLGIPWVHLAQTEALRQIQGGQEKEPNEIGFVPRERTLD
jgi:hypothetical protein